MGAAKNILVNLQICRGVAALLVVIGHSLHDYDAIAARAGLPADGAIFNWGCGVDIFFVISGFIMVHVASDDFTKPHAGANFILKRIARIVPLYWSMTTLVIVGGIIAPRLLNEPIGGVWHAVASYLFIPDKRAAGRDSAQSWRL